MRICMQILLVNYNREPISMYDMYMHIHQIINIVYIASYTDSKCTNYVCEELR